MRKFNRLKRGNIKDFFLQKKQGFTLMELLVCVVLVCILAVIAIPGYTEYKEKSRLVAAAQVFEKELSLAFAQSKLDDGSEIKMVFNSGCYGVTAKTTCDCSDAASNSCEYGAVQNINGIDFLSSITAMNFLGMKRGSVGTQGTIVFSAKSGRTLEVTFSQLGTVVKACSNYNIGGYPAC